MASFPLLLQLMVQLFSYGSEAAPFIVAVSGPKERRPVQRISLRTLFPPATGTDAIFADGLEGADIEKDCFYPTLLFFPL
jgi:hypothetical protein